MITVPLCIGVYLVSPEFVPLYFGAGYDSCIPMIQVFSLILVVTSLNNIISNQCLIAAGKQKKMNGFLIASSLINAVANFVFIQLAGGLGATIASFVSELFQLVLLIVYDKDIVDVKNFLRKMLGYILKSFPMIGGVYCIQKISINSGILSIMLQVIVGVFLYFIMLFITKDDCFMKIFNGVIKRKR
jgi:O-antigen/teichoic acid export membrane protein